jgi:hypothetical protein
MLIGICGWVAGLAGVARADSNAVQAIQQASDPSAAVSAYANGMAQDRNDPQLYQAYISRMVDFGLPEMAFHQAETLTTLRSDSGLAWAVIAHVNARRGQMPEAVSAVVLAGQFAPDHPFVQKTAGEIIAWYDYRADKGALSDTTREAVAKVKGLLANRSDYRVAYDTARHAYQQQSTSQAPTTAPLTPESDEHAQAQYAPDYYGGVDYDSEPGWYWWYPAGYFAGYSFFPLGAFFVFEDHHHHHHDRLFAGHSHHVSFAAHSTFNHDGRFFSAGRNAFFGTATRLAMLNNDAAVNSAAINQPATVVQNEPPSRTQVRKGTFASTATRSTQVPLGPRTSPSTTWPAPTAARQLPTFSTQIQPNPTLPSGVWSSPAFRSPQVAQSAPGSMMTPAFSGRSSMAGTEFNGAGGVMRGAGSSVASVPRVVVPGGGGFHGGGAVAGMGRR